jgi:hypothetical protein
MYGSIADGRAKTVKRSLMSEQLTRSILRETLSILPFLLLVGCSIETGPSIEFKPAESQPGQEEGLVSSANPTGTESPEISPRLGIVQDNEATAMENGGRVALGDGKIVEVFLSPYPPDWQTDLHLFLMDKETFEPIADVEVDLTYDMVFMDHGIDAQIGIKLQDGHYVLPLAFLMYGDWNVDTTLQLPEGEKHLEFIVKFLAEGQG